MNSFYSAYGNDAIETLKDMMYKYNITNEYSICMFLATLGAESGDGTELVENATDFTKKFYTKNTKGAGLLQVTGMDQKEFLEDIFKNLLVTDPMYNKVKTALESYPDTFSKKTINGITSDLCDTDNNFSISDFIAKNYPIESATWYWGSLKKLYIIMTLKLII